MPGANTIRFDASADRLLRTASVLDYNSAYTVVCWFYPVALPANGNQATLFALDANSQTANYDLFQINGSGGNQMLRSDVDDGSNNTTQDGGTDLSTNTWYYGAVVRASATSHSVYLGTLTSAAAQEGSTNTRDVSGRATAATRMEMGAYTTSNTDAFSGRVANIKVWSRALTLDEIIAEQWQYLPRYTNSLHLWTPLIEVSLASQTIDYSGNGRDWTQSGTLTQEEGPPLTWGRTHRFFIPASAPPIERTATPVTMAISTVEARTATPVTVAIQATQARTATPATLSAVAGYAALVYTTSGIQSYWRLGETAGTLADDLVGSVDGTYVGSPSLNQASLLASDSADGSVAFDGSDDAITFASSAYNFVGTAAFSVEFLVQLDTDDLGYPLYLVTKEDSPPGGTGWSVIQIDDMLGLEIYDGGTLQGAAYITSLATDTPYHIVFTVSSSTIVAYLNGSPIDTQARASMPSVTENLRIGEMSSSNNQFMGRLDEVAIYNVALSGATVLAHATATGRVLGASTATPVLASIGIRVVDDEVHTAPTGHGPFELVDGERVVYIITVAALTPSVRGDTVTIEVYATDAEAVNVERVNVVVMEEPGQVVIFMEGVAGANRPFRYLSIIPDADTEMDGVLLILNGSDQLTD